MALLKLCRCGKPISMSDKKCESCQGKREVITDEKRKDKQKEYNKTYDMYKRDKKSTAFYKSHEWEQVRLIALNRDRFLCVHCFNNKKITPADVVDHIIPIKVDWSLRLTLSNLQALCHKHHNRKTYEDLKKYGG